MNIAYHDPDTGDHGTLWVNTVRQAEVRIENGIRWSINLDPFTALELAAALQKAAEDAVEELTDRERQILEG